MSTAWRSGYSRFGTSGPRSALPFLPGSLLMARGAYPETANDSLCCGPTDWSADDDDLERCCCDVCGCCARRRPPAEQALISGQPGAAAV